MVTLQTEQHETKRARFGSLVHARTCTNQKMAAHGLSLENSSPVHHSLLKEMGGVC